MHFNSALKHAILLATLGAPAAFASPLIVYQIEGVALAGSTGEFSNLQAGDAVDLTFALELSQINGAAVHPTSVSFSDYGGTCCGGGPSPVLVMPAMVNLGSHIGPDAEPYRYVNDQIASDISGGTSDYSVYSAITGENNLGFEFALNISSTNGSAFSPTGAMPAFSTRADSGTGLVEAASGVLHYDFTQITEISVNGVAVPEPLTAGLFGLGLLAASLRRRRAA